MPHHYRRAYDSVAVREHAAIVHRRADAPAHAEIWRRLPNGAAVLCVVADDRPGLLSLVSASLAVERIDVTAVQAYTRQLDRGGAEAVDFFWLRRVDAGAMPIGDEDASHVLEVLRGLVTGKLTLESVASRARPRESSRPGGTRVAVAEKLDAGQAVLTVQAVDRPGLLLTITLALFRARVQIVASKVATKGGVAADRFTIAEHDGSRLSAERCAEVRAAVIAAVDSLDLR